MIPPFHSAVDRAISYLDPKVGLLGVADFFVPSKYDLPLRQMTWLRRFFWRYVTFPPIHGIFAAKDNCLLVKWYNLPTKQLLMNMRLAAYVLLRLALLLTCFTVQGDLRHRQH